MAAAAARLSRRRVSCAVIVVADVGASVVLGSARCDLLKLSKGCFPVTAEFSHQYGGKAASLAMSGEEERGAGGERTG